MKKIIFTFLGFALLISPLFSQNDDCANPVSLTINGPCTSGDVAGATLSRPATCSGQADEDVWFSIVAPANGQILIDVNPSSSLDPVVEMFNDDCAGTSLFCMDVFATGEAEQLAATGLTSGNIYLIRVYDYDAGPPLTTTFTICATGTITGTQNSLISNLNIYPNPVSSKLTLDLEKISGQIISTRLINTEGQIVYADNEPKGAMDYRAEINTEKIQDGIYLLQILINDTILNKKVIVKH